MISVHFIRHLVGLISLLNMHTEAGKCLVKAMVFLMQSVCPDDPKITPASLQMRKVFSDCTD